MEKAKAIFATVLAWIDGNPRKAFAAGLGLGLVIGLVL